MCGDLTRIQALSSAAAKCGAEKLRLALPSAVLREPRQIESLASPEGSRGTWSHRAPLILLLLFRPS